MNEIDVKSNDPKAIVGMIVVAELAAAMQCAQKFCNAVNVSRPRVHLLASRHSLGGHIRKCGISDVGGVSIFNVDVVADF